jgi:hypothetical protein
MGAEDMGLTLQGLAQRLEALERENELMRSENDALRSKVATLEGSGTRRDEIAALRSSETTRAAEPASESGGLVSRRSLLGKAGAAAVAAVAAGTLLHPREARAENDFFDVIYARKVLVSGGDALVSVSATNDHGAEALSGRTSSASNAAVYGENLDSGPAVEGIAQGSNGRGVNGTGRYGVWGESNQAGFYGVTGRNLNTDGTGVRGVANNDNGRAGVRGEGSTGVWGSSSKSGFSGVYGQHTGTSGFGMVGDGKGEAGAGVLGRNNDGTGVWGQSSKAGYGGVTAEHTGTAGFGVIGLGKGATGAGVLGRNSSGNGMQGEGNNGVHGKATGGYGGLFEGGRAQLRIVPKGSAGKPTTGTHTKGEIYMDSAGTMFVCTVDGTPGTWRRVQTVAV